jgi:RNA 2',3'-cyclic 3'-phosphodiesterase
VSRPASVDGRDRLRLFCALTLPTAVQDALGAWQRESLKSAGRLVEPTNLHVTLAFLGHRPAVEVEPVAASLREAARVLEAPIVLTPVRYRETRSVSMLVFDDEDGRAERLAVELHGRLERLGVYEPEARRWLPHVTVARFRSRPQLRPSVPDLPPFSPSGAAVYHSLLGPGGARYEMLEPVALGSSDLGG